MLEEVTEMKILIIYSCQKVSISPAVNFCYAPQLKILLENVNRICHGKPIWLESSYVKIAYPRSHDRKIKSF